LHRLRKYGLTVEDILQARDQMEQELEHITHLQQELEALEQEKEKVLQEYDRLAAMLSQKRREQAARLEQGLGQELVDLGLEQSRVEVRFTPVNEPTSGGAEEVEFYFSANMGEPLKPLAKVASGGEISRLMLALKSLLAGLETVGTFVFDEVDSGIGGRTLPKVGEKLSKIARNKQVFCITHAAPVAAFADQHYKIWKEVVEERTRTRVEKLTEEERVEELARMLGGEEREITRRHARELRERYGFACRS